MITCASNDFLSKKGPDHILLKTEERFLEPQPYLGISKQLMIDGREVPIGKCLFPYKQISSHGLENSLGYIHIHECVHTHIHTSQETGVEVAEEKEEGREKVLGVT